MPHNSVFRQFMAMTKARTMEFVRDRGSLLWNLLFPIVLVLGFALAFSGNTNGVFKVGIIGPKPLSGEFFQQSEINFIEYPVATSDIEELVAKLRKHQMDLLIDPANNRYWSNPESPASRVAKQLFIGFSNNSAVGAASITNDFKEEIVRGKAVKYVDWLVPGVIGMNIMFSCLFGVGFVIVRYRKNGVLKRLKATPVSALNFVLAQGLSRFLIVIITCVVVYVATNLILGFTMNGSYFDLLLITVLGIICMLSLGLVFAARMRNEELAGGLMNLITFPMMIFSGVFFSLEGTPAFMQGFAQIFPLTHVIDAARKIMIDGYGLAQLWPQFALVGGLSVVFLAISAWLFKWE